MMPAPPMPTHSGGPPAANKAPYHNNNNNNNNNHRSMGGRGIRPPKQPSRGRGEISGGRTSARNGRGGRGYSGKVPGRAGGNDRNSNVVNKIAPTTGVPFGHVPAYLPGSSSLVEELDKRIMIVLRDGRHLVGVSSFSPTNYCLIQP